LAYRILALHDFVWHRWTQQPGSQRVLTGSARRLGASFIETAPPEYVEIVRVEMFGIEKALAGVAMSCPHVVEPCETATIELFEPRGCAKCPQQPLMNNPQ